MVKPGLPKWHDLKNPKNNINGADPGKILLNAQCFPAIEYSKRFPKDTTADKVKYLFCVYLHGGYNLAPEVSAKKIIANVKITIGNNEFFLFDDQDADKKEKERDRRLLQVSKNPVWKHRFPEIIKLPQT